MKGHTRLSMPFLVRLPTFIYRIIFFIYRVFSLIHRDFSFKYLVFLFRNSVISEYSESSEYPIILIPLFVDFQSGEPSWFTFLKNHALQIVVNKRITKSVNVKVIFKIQCIGRYVD